MYIDGLQGIASGSRVRSVPDNNGATLPGSGTEGDLFELTAVDSSNQPGIYKYVSSAWVFLYPLELDSYDLVNNVLGTPDDGAIVLRFPAPRAFTIKENFANCLASAATAATAQAVFTIKQNATTLGTITFAASGTTGSFSQSTSGDMAISAGDVIQITAPATADTTLADIGITLAGHI